MRAKLCYRQPVFQIMILVGLMMLLVVVLGLPLLLGSDSPIPDYIGFVILAVAVAFFVWGGLWWILLPIAGLVVLVVWMDRGGRDAPVDPAGLDHRGWSARTRLRFRLWWAALLAVPLLIGSCFILPQGIAVWIFFAGMLIAMAAMSLFRFSFVRSARRDEPAL